jgi:hypothetical protein
MNNSTKIICPRCGTDTGHYDLRGPLNDALQASGPLDRRRHPSIEHAATFYRGVLGEAEDAELTP